jgi:hypothetical protein
VRYDARSTSTSETSCSRTISCDVLRIARRYISLDRDSPWLSFVRGLGILNERAQFQRRVWIFAVFMYCDVMDGRVQASSIPTAAQMKLGNKLPLLAGSHRPNGGSSWLGVWHEHVVEHREMPRVECGELQACMLGSSSDQSIRQANVMAFSVLPTEQSNFDRD